MNAVAESHPTNDERSNSVDAVGRGSLVKRFAIIALLPLALFAVLTPDWYSYQNGLDPYIYTGYVRNLDVVLAWVGDSHYIVTRWPAYLPGHLLGDAVGTTPAYFFLRWAGAATVAAMVMAVGWRRWSITLATCLAALALVSPMTLRMLFTDYPDHVVLPVGCVLIVTCTVWPSSRWTALVAGISAALLITCNPAAGSIALVSGIVWLIRVPGWRARALHLAISGVAAAAVLVAAYAYFRWHYGIPNVYRPTIDYTKLAKDYVDPLRSKHLLWMAYRLWIYLPAFVLLGCLALARRGVSFTAAERSILAITAAQYGFQWFYQFARNGTTLELSYYWSYMVPSLTLATVVLIAKLVAHTRARTVGAFSAITLVVLAVLPSPTPTLIPAWYIGLVVAMLIVGLLRWPPRWANSVCAAAVVVLFMAGQIGAPKNEHLYAGEWRVEAAYDTVYESDSPGVRGLHAATWFEGRVSASGIQLEDGLWFWLGGGDAYRMAELYFATASEYWLNDGFGAGMALTPKAEGLLRAGDVEYVALLGLSAEVDGMLSTLRQLGLSVDVVSDGIASENGSTRAVLARLSR